MNEDQLIALMAAVMYATIEENPRTGKPTVQWCVDNALVILCEVKARFPGHREILDSNTSL